MIHRPSRPQGRFSLEIINLPYRLLSALRSYLFPPKILPRTPPFTFDDTKERVVHLRPYTEKDVDALVQMYEDFSMLDRVQGVPPMHEAGIRDWLKKLATGVNVVATHEGSTVGHVVFVPDGTDRHELAIFVHPSYQRAGIGSQLMAAGLAYAKFEGVTYVWLSVEASANGLQRFYNRAGFRMINPMGMYQRMSRYL